VEELRSQRLAEEQRGNQPPAQQQLDQPPIQRTATVIREQAAQPEDGTPFELPSSAMLWARSLGIALAAGALVVIPGMRIQRWLERR
jgi:hypothetical protein